MYFLHNIFCELLQLFESSSAIPSFFDFFGDSADTLDPLSILDSDFVSREH